MFELIVGFFEIGAVGSYLFFGILSIICISATERSKFGLSIFALLIGFGIYHNQLLSVLTWQTFGIGLLIYTVIGILWSLFRWYKFCTKYVKKHINDDYPSWMEKEKVSKLISESEKKNEKRKYNEESIRSHLSPSLHKSMFAGWIIYWPWSMLWNIVGDICNSIYDFMKHVYGVVSNSIINAAFKSGQK